jgi:hypothetical protein
MPLQLDLRKDRYQAKFTHNPLPQLDIDVARILEGPVEMTADIIFGAINQLLGWIDQATGLDFLSWAELLEGQLGPEELLSKLHYFLNPKTAQDLINGLNLFSPILTQDTGTLLSQMIPFLDATKINSGQFPQDMVHGLEDALADLEQGIEDAAEAIGSAVTSTLSSIAGYIGIGNIGATAPELLLNPAYRGVESVAGGGLWQWDGTVTRTADGSGSVRITANGLTNHLLSDPKVYVAQGQTMTVAHGIMWAGVTGVGAVFKLGLNVYDITDTLIAQPDVATVSNPAAASAGWQMLSGTYVIPANARSIRMRLTTTGAFTAGTAHWDDGSLKATGKLAQDMITNLVNDLTARVLNIDYTQLLSTLGLGNTSLAAIASRFQFTSAAGFFDSAKLGNIGGIPLLPAGSVPFLDATKIATGILGIGRVPTDQLNIGNIADLQHLTDNITQYVFGGNPTGTLIDDARNALNTHWNTTQSNTEQIQSLTQQAGGAASSGISAVYRWADYPDSAQMPAGWVTTYSGSGTSTLGVEDGETHWYLVNNGSRIAVTHNPTPTNTDFQVIGCTVSIGPDSNAESWIIGRVNAANDTYVFVRVYPSGFLAWSGELGCMVGNVKTVFAAGKSLPAAADSRFFVGVGANARAYQFYVGGSLVHNIVEPGSVSVVGAANRFFGIRGSTNGSAKPSDASILSVSDNALPSNVGSTMRMARQSTGAISIPTGNVNKVMDNNFWTAVQRQTPDFTVNLANGMVTASIEGTYAVNVRMNMNNAAPATRNVRITLWVNGSVETVGDGTWVELGSSDNGYQFWTVGRFMPYLKAGDYFQIGYQANSGPIVSTSWTPAGNNTTDCYVEVALLNKSLA